MTDDLDLEALAGAAGIGAVAGLRSLTAPAMLSQAARTGSIDLAGGPCAFLGTQQTADIATGLALAELVADKLPATPNRIAPLPLAARAVSGAIVGAAVYSARKRPPGPGIVAGALAAIGAAFLGYSFRKKFPGFFPALLEDAATVAIAVAVLRKEAEARVIEE
jgi:uncharacterized membrane protein